MSGQRRTPEHDQIMKRQRVLADFGDFALQSEELDEILQRACELISEALQTDLAKILEIDHEKQELLVKAGFGWSPGIVGRMRLPMSERSSETYSIEKGEPVVTQDISKEDRFAFPRFLKEHGAVAIVNVPIFLPGKEKKAYGLLQVDSRKPRAFGEDDQEFLRTYATILGPVIDRLHKVHDLQVALGENRHLLQELQHRIKNHIGTIRSLVSMRRREVKSEEARRELTVIGDRIETLRLVHEQLYAAGTADHLRMQPYLTQLADGLCHMHEEQSGSVRLDISIADAEVTPEIAVPLGLIVNEFVTNSLKYAFDGKGGMIAIDIGPRAEGRIPVRLSDNGKGLPAVPRRAAPGSGTGIKLIEGLCRQLGAEPVWSSEGGTTLYLQFLTH
jgi:two-component sensor histidine kinase